MLANQLGAPNGYGWQWKRCPIGGSTDTPEEGVAIRGAYCTSNYVGTEDVRETLDLKRER